ncbi:MAG: orotate phosphoribosyltransferase [Deltaproteobacteria bacterium]|nr:orotate phosphoribosyltransferase [Deltaproteobacteria bacterium]
MIPEARQAFFEFLVRAGALRFGDFVLRSGGRSPFFLNLGDVAAGRDLDRLGAFLAEGLHEAFPDATLLYGPPYKGIVLAAVAAVGAWRAFQWDLPVAYARKERKDHGEGGAFVGRRPQAGDRVVLVDDVLSTGGAKLEAADLLRGACGVDPIGVIVCLDRRVRHARPEPGLPPLHALADLDDLVEWLAVTDPDRAELVRAFQEGSP